MIMYLMYLSYVFTYLIILTVKTIYDFSVNGFEMYTILQNLVVAPVLVIGLSVEYLVYISKDDKEMYLKALSNKVFTRKTIIIIGVLCALLAILISIIVWWLLSFVQSDIWFYCGLGLIFVNIVFCPLIGHAYILDKCEKSELL